MDPWLSMFFCRAEITSIEVRAVSVGNGDFEPTAEVDGVHGEKNRRSAAAMDGAADRRSK